MRRNGVLFNLWFCEGKCVLWRDKQERDRQTQIRREFETGRNCQVSSNAIFVCVSISIYIYMDFWAVKLLIHNRIRLINLINIWETNKDVDFKRKRKIRGFLAMDAFLRFYAKFCEDWGGRDFSGIVVNDGFTLWRFDILF